MQQLDMLVNKLEQPTWNKLRLNGAQLSCVSVEDGPSDAAMEMENFTETADDRALAVVPAGLGNDMNLLAQLAGAALPSVLCLRPIAAERKSTLYLRFNYADRKKHFNRLEIIAPEACEVELVMSFASAPASGGTAAVQTRILAQAGAKVRLVQVQTLGQGFLHLNDVGVLLGENASFDLVQLELGAAQVYDGVRTELEGAGASFEASIGYYGRQSQHLDFNVVAKHYGRKTESTITAEGVLRGKAQKLFRSTIDFLNGAAAAVGEENEHVLLLDEGVVNQSIPLILCAEEDVAGNHGASIGRLDEDLLFYLTSRGFSVARATELLARARIDAVCAKITEPVALDLARKYLEGVSAHAE